MENNVKMEALESISRINMSIDKMDGNIDHIMTNLDLLLKTINEMKEAMSGKESGGVDKRFFRV